MPCANQAEGVFLVSKILKAIKVLILTDKQRLLAMEPIGPEMPGWHALLLYRNIPLRHMYYSWVLIPLIENKYPLTQYTSQKIFEVPCIVTTEPQW
jgi:hypothetical protein